MQLPIRFCKLAALTLITLLAMAAVAQTPSSNAGPAQNADTNPNDPDRQEAMRLLPAVNVEVSPVGVGNASPLVDLLLGIEDELVERSAKLFDFAGGENTRSLGAIGIDAVGVRRSPPGGGRTSLSRGLAAAHFRAEHGIARVSGTGRSCSACHRAHEFLRLSGDELL